MEKIIKKIKKNVIKKRKDKIMTKTEDKQLRSQEGKQLRECGKLNNFQLYTFNFQLKKAFTLAEVLITLAVIGVVAAMTIPSTVKKYKNKALETSFKKSYSNLYNALNRAMIEEQTIKGDNGPGSKPQIKDAIVSQFTKIKIPAKSDSLQYKNTVRTYEKKEGSSFGCIGDFEFDIITPDGSALYFIQNCTLVWAIIDTNGLKKGPNAYGHDLFTFIITDKGKLIPATTNSHYAAGQYLEQARENCKKDSTSSYNGLSCGYFALQNKCPYEENKPYWECLP